MALFKPKLKKKKKKKILETVTPTKLFIFQKTELSYISGSNFPSSKNKKSHSEKIVFREIELYSPKKLNKNPLGETGCLSNH